MITPFFNKYCLYNMDHVHFSGTEPSGFTPQFRTKVACISEFEWQGVGYCGLVFEYFIFMEFWISHIRLLEVEWPKKLRR